MKLYRGIHSALMLFLLGAGIASLQRSGSAADMVPPPKVDEVLAPKKAERTAVFAGGCFWGIEAVFEHVKGVKNVVSGYSGGSGATAEYEIVSSGTTGHAESVEIKYDPSQITYGQ